MSEGGLAGWPSLGAKASLAILADASKVKSVIGSPVSKSSSAVRFARPADMPSPLRLGIAADTST